jgi:hypothetical protein
MASGDPRLRLVVLSFLMLFVELALIRWTGSRVVYLSYFSNFVLLGSFLGIGIGFLRAKARVDLFRWSPFALAAFVLFVSLFPAYIDRSGSDLIFFGHFQQFGLPIWVMLPLVFVAAATIMAMVTQGVARQFAAFPALEAYRLDVIGSLAGIAAFALLSFLHAPPVAWGLVVAAVYLWLWLRSRPAIHLAAGAAALVLLVAPLAAESMEPNTEWSPYYKVQARPGADGIDVRVNAIPHQAIHTTEHRRQHEPIYFLPYERLNATEPPREVLIVGAGSGSDVAIALSKGAGHIDAVEIDPVLQRLGARMHPDRPYASPKVTVHINDGRAFLEQTDKKYDLVLFALPDSLTLVSGQSSLRLESYLFTVEAVESVRDHLAPGGAFAMYNFYREAWLIDRLAATMQQAFGSAPCVDLVGEEHLGLAVLTASLDPAALDCPARWQPRSPPVPEPASDDRPFLYLREPGIPGFYLVTIALILVAAVVMVRVGSGPFAHMRGYADLFFMGAAFLLLETKNVVQFALLFGTTWLVNALVFGGVLLTVLAAIEVSRRVRVRRPALMYAALLGSLAVAWLVPPGVLIGLPAVPRFLLATAVAFAPIFLANLVFAERFRETSDSPSAFGANLLGAMVGGVLEYLALLTGFHALLLVTALLYGIAFAAGRGHLAGGGKARPA